MKTGKKNGTRFIIFLVLCFWALVIPDAGGETFVEQDGVVSMEAEHFTVNHGYTVRTDNGPDDKAAGWSGDGWMYSESEAAQRLDYEITFSQTGTYWLHLRTLSGYTIDWGSDVSGIDNGYHAELDGHRISGDGIYVRKLQTWTWFARPQEGEDSDSISFTVDTPGTHTFSIVRREELSRLDKIVIHDGLYGTDARGTLEGEGPAETLGGVEEDPVETVIEYDDVVILEEPEMEDAVPEPISDLSEELPAEEIEEPIPEIHEPEPDASVEDSGTGVTEGGCGCAFMTM